MRVKMSTKAKKNITKIRHRCAKPTTSLAEMLISLFDLDETNTAINVMKSKNPSCILNRFFKED